MNETPAYATSIASWSMAIGNALEVYGIDPVKIFADVGIDLKSADSAFARFPVESVQKVWRYAYEHTDEDFGLTVSQFLGPASFSSLGFGLYASSTLLEMLERIVRYRCVISHSFFAELIDRGDHVVLSTSDKRSIKTPITGDAIFGYIIAVCRQIYRPDFAPVKMTLMRQPLKSIDKLSQFVRAPIEFSSPGNSIVFARESLDHPLKCGDKLLASKLDKITEQYIAENGLISEYMFRVRTEIEKLLALGAVNIDAVAENMHVTVRTLQRRLKSENSSYHTLLDNIRQNLAMQYIDDADLTMAQIALKLGFNDSRSFTKSFNRWTGCSVTEFRNKGK